MFYTSINFINKIIKKDTNLEKKIKDLEYKYISLVRWRDVLFRKLMDNNKIYAPLQMGIIGSRGGEALLNLIISNKIIRFNKRNISTLKDIYEKGNQKKYNYIWIMVRLNGIIVYKGNYPNTILHSNCIFINNITKKVYLFEPHGSNLSQQHNIKNYYNSKKYFQLFQIICKDIFPLEYTIFTPDMYLPEIFCQSWTNDTFCSFWSLFFLIYSTKYSPEEFVKCIIDNKNKLKYISNNLINNPEKWIIY